MKKSLSLNTVKILFILFNGNPMAAFGSSQKSKVKSLCLLLGRPILLLFSQNEKKVGLFAKAYHISDKI